MELLRFAVRRNILSEVIYVFLNVALAISVWLLVSYFTTPWLAYGLIVLSKWRTLSVRPRFWFANVQASIVDVLVGLSFATLLWQGQNSVILQAILSLLYIGWLLYLKPRSTKRAVAAQAGVAQFAALSSLFILGFSWDVSIVVLIAWIIGYSAARHILSSLSAEDTTLLSFIWGFFVAELVWIGYHWNIAYALPITWLGLRLPQVAIVVALLGFIAMRGYSILTEEREKPRIKALVWPAVAVGCALLVLLLAFNGYDATNL